jgi:hypothetical protein
MDIEFGDFETEGGEGVKVDPQQDIRVAEAQNQAGKSKHIQSFFEFLILNLFSLE